MAAEAIINALIRSHRERSGLFPVEGAQAKHIRAAALEGHILTHHILNGIAGQKLINKRRGKSHVITSGEIEN
jgi:hypothetical protein